MNVLKQTADINNEGVHLLDSGDLVGAQNCFQHATATMNCFVQGDSCTRRKSLPPSLIPADSCSNQGDYCCLPNFECGNFYVHDNPIELPGNFNKPLTEDEFQADVLNVSAVVIFNYALSCHLLANTSGRTAPSTRARILYELALKLLGTAQRNSGVLVLLEALCLNNLAQIYYENCCYKECQEALVCMYELIVWSDWLQSYLADDGLEEMMTNHLSCQSPPAAAAAA